MGVYPSKTELFLPSETLLRCTPDRCWCKGHHHRGDSRYVYVERGGDGRERYHDGFDMMSQLMGNGNGMGGVWPAWKDPSQWNIRDMERFTEFFSEWQNREMGRKGRVNGAAGPGGIYGYGGGGVGRGEFERMQSEMEERFKRMAEEYARGNEERDAFLFGSERERRKEMFQGQIWRMIQEMWPQLASMASSGGGMMGGAMGFPPGMGGPIGAGFGGPWGGMANMGGGGSPMGWMGNGNGMAGAMPNMPFQSPMDADGYGRRNYRRGRPRPYGFADEELEEHVGLANPYPSMRGHGPRTVPRHRFGDEGDFGGLGGASPMPRPRGPSGSGPHRPGGDLGGGGLAYDDPLTAGYDIPSYRTRDPLRPRRTYTEQPDILRTDPVIPPVSPRVTTPLAEPAVAATSPIVEPAANIHVSQTTTATNTFPGGAARHNVPPSGIVVEETIADPEIGPSVRHTSTPRFFGVHIRATPVDPLRSAQAHRTPPYPADTSLSGMDARANRAKREVRFAEQEHVNRLGQQGRLREGLEGDVGDIPGGRDI